MLRAAAPERGCLQQYLPPSRPSSPAGCVPLAQHRRSRAPPGHLPVCPLLARPVCPHCAQTTRRPSRMCTLSLCGSCWPGCRWAAGPAGQPACRAAGLASSLQAIFAGSKRAAKLMAASLCSPSNLFCAMLEARAPHHTFLLHWTSAATESGAQGQNHTTGAGLRQPGRRRAGQHGRASACTCSRRAGGRGPRPLGIRGRRLVGRRADACPRTRASGRRGG